MGFVQEVNTNIYSPEPRDDVFCLKTEFSYIESGLLGTL